MPQAVFTRLEMGYCHRLSHITQGAIAEAAPLGMPARLILRA